MKPQWLLASLLLSVLAAPSLPAQNHTDRGAVLGGVGGALIGAAIGEQNDEAGPGAIIGGAIGAITGAAIGNSMDQEEARFRALQQQRAWQLQRAVSVSDVVMMTHNRLSDGVIIGHIQQNGVQRRLEVSDVISLHQQGVSEAVISAMQRAPLAGYVPPPAVPYRTPVIVEEHHCITPHFYYRPRPVHYRYHHPHHHRHHHPSGIHWSIGIGR
jgi:uncharacterized protein YcfJ